MMKNNLKVISLIILSILFLNKLNAVEILSINQKEELLQIKVLVNEKGIQFSNYHILKKRNYYFQDSLYEEIYLYIPEYIEISDSILYINFANKDPSYSYDLNESNKAVISCRCEEEIGQIVNIEVGIESRQVEFVEINLIKIINSDSVLIKK